MLRPWQNGLQSMQTVWTKIKQRRIKQVILKWSVIGLLFALRICAAKLALVGLREES